MAAAFVTKRSQYILSITAAIFFIIAFIIDVTGFGQYRNIWNNIEITNVLTILGVIMLTGLCLGLFLFYNRKYWQRIRITIPIAFILFSCADISKTAIGYYGLNEEYNYFSAKHDISNGKIQLLETGLTLPEPNSDWNKEREAQKKIEQKFGYKSVYLGCIVTHGIIIYNRVMQEYLEKVNGNDWKLKRRQMLDSIIHSNN